MLHAEENFLSPKGIIADKLSDFTSSEWPTHAICEELIAYMKHNDDVVIAVVNDELCFCRLREE